jgi:UDP-glucose 4-epimerase
MRALVTGGAGFIGSTICDLLIAHGHEVFVVDDLSTGSLSNLEDARRDARIKFHRFDIGTEGFGDLVPQVKPEVVLHLAAQASVPKSVADPLLDADVNIMGLLRVLDACVASEVRKIVFASSGGTIYGAQKKFPVKEEAVGRPLSPYGITKKAAEDYLRFYEAEYKLEFTSLALANVYGPRQDPHGEGAVVSRFALRLIEGRAPRIDGTGEQTRDFIFVDDVANAFIRAVDAGSGETINIATGAETTINELYRTMAHAARFTGEPEYGPARPGDVVRSCLDPSKAERVLEWKAWTPLDEGIERTLAWFSRGR